MAKPSQRSSNIELMRIVVMLAIIAHHYVVNSGVSKIYDFANHPTRTLFLQLWGMSGKAGINAFVLISGYFMCNSKMTPLRYLKVAFPILLYRTIRLAASVALGSAKLSWKAVANIVLGLFQTAGNNGSFSSSIVVFYLLMPILIAVSKRITKETHLGIVIASLAMYTGLGTFFGNTYLFNEVSWFCVLFFIAAWIRNYASDWMNSRRVSACLLVGSLALTAASIVAHDVFPTKEDFYFLVSDPAKLGSISIGLSTFLFFRNIEMPQSKLVNWVASHTFGVLLLHANSFARKYLWLPGSLFDTQAAYALPLPQLVLHSVMAVAAVFAVGTAFDACIATPIERVFYSWYSRHEDTLVRWLRREKPAH